MMGAIKHREVATMRNVVFGGVLAFGIVFVACGGDDDGGQSPFDFQGNDDATSESNNDGNGGSGDSNDDGDGTGDAGEVTVTTEPGRAVVVVDGETIEYAAAGSQSYRCEIGDDVLTINFQTSGGHNLLIQGSIQGNGWVANIGFKSEDHENNVQFSGNIPANADSFGLRDNQLSFEGTVSRREDFDPATDEDVPATIAVNCASPGGEPTASIGGEDFVFPLSGAQSVTCDVAEDAFEVRINRLSMEGRQLGMQGQQESGNWLGSMSVILENQRFRSSLPRGGEGLEIKGSTISYTGTFTDEDGAESNGSIAITCQ